MSTYAWTIKFLITSKVNMEKAGAPMFLVPRINYILQPQSSRKTARTTAGTNDEKKISVYDYPTEHM